MLWWDDNVELLLDVSGKAKEIIITSSFPPARPSPTRAKRISPGTCDGMKAAAFVGKDFLGAWKFSCPFRVFSDANKTCCRWVGLMVRNFTRHRLADSSESDKSPASVPEYQRSTRFAIPARIFPIRPDHFPVRIVAMRIQFCGADRTVTGPVTLIEINGARVLLDCGMYQGKRDVARAMNEALPISEKY